MLRSGYLCLLLFIVCFPFAVISIRIFSELKCIKHENVVLHLSSEYDISQNRHGSSQRLICFPKHHLVVPLNSCLNPKYPKSSVIHFKHQKNSQSILTQGGGFLEVFFCCWWVLFVCLLACFLIKEINILFIDLPARNPENKSQELLNFLVRFPGEQNQPCPAGTQALSTVRFLTHA